MALVKSIIFVDGENLTLRYQAMLASGRIALPTISHIPDVFVWSAAFANDPIQGINTDTLRINYYTSAVGDEDLIASVRSRIAAHTYSMSGSYYGACQLLPHVFKKAVKSRKSRLVDINITIDMMRHAYTSAVDVVYLFSGDGDFLELVREIERSGKQVRLAAFSSGLEPVLRHSVDYFIPLDDLFFEPIAPLLDEGKGVVTAADSEDTGDIPKECI